MSHTPTPSTLHPFCNVCGWRKGGVDSWDGTRCKCGHYAMPLGFTDLREVIAERESTPEGAAGITKARAALAKVQPASADVARVA